MAVKPFETLKKMHLTMNLMEEAGVVKPIVRPSWQARIGVRSPH